MSILKHGIPFPAHLPHDWAAFATVFQLTYPLQLIHHSAYSSWAIPAFVHLFAQASPLSAPVSFHDVDSQV